MYCLMGQVCIIVFLKGLVTRGNNVGQDSYIYVMYQKIIFHRCNAKRDSPTKLSCLRGQQEIRLDYVDCCTQLI